MSLEHVRVLVAGGSPLLQAGLVTALSQDDRLTLVAQVRDVTEARVACSGATPPCDVVLLNAERPDVEAAALLSVLRRHASEIKLLVLTDNQDRDVMLTALREGVHGYGFGATLAPQELCAAVVAVAQWQSWACPVATRTLMATAARPIAPLVAPRGVSALSDREVQVLCHVARGAKDDQIANALTLSRNTVKTYLRRICGKLGVQSRTEAVRQAVERGIVPDRRLNPRSPDGGEYRRAA